MNTTTNQTKPINTTIKKMEKRIAMLESAIREIYEAMPQTIDAKIKKAEKLIDRWNQKSRTTCNASANWCAPPEISGCRHQTKQHHEPHT